MSNLPKDVHGLYAWLARKVERHADWESGLFGMRWTTDDDSEERAWELYYVRPRRKRRTEFVMARGNSHKEGCLRNFFVSEFFFDYEAWAAFETEEGYDAGWHFGGSDRPRGWQLLGCVLELTTRNVIEPGGLNATSVLAGMLQAVRFESDRKSGRGSFRFFFRRFCNWYASDSHAWLPAPRRDGVRATAPEAVEYSHSHGAMECEFLAPVPVTPSRCAFYVDDDHIDYGDVDEVYGQEDKWEDGE